MRKLTGFEKERRQWLVKELRYLGLTTPEIAKAINFSESLVHAILKECKVNKNKQKRTETFGLAFRRYAELETTELKTRQEEELCCILRKWLGIERKRIVDFFEGVVETLQELTILFYPPGCEAYINLLRVVFGEKIYQGIFSSGIMNDEMLLKYLQEEIDDEIAKRWEKYLKEVADGAIPPPHSLAGAKAPLMREYLAEYRSQIMPTLTDTSLKYIDAIISSTLTEREARIIRLRFGLKDGGVPHTLKEIGQKLGVTLERIRQIEGKALRKLRHPSKGLKYLGRPLHSTLEKEIKEKTREIEAALRIAEMTTLSKKYPLLPMLLRPTEEIKFSIRASNCLRNADIKYIGELVQKTEKELLKTRYFGRKSLREIEEVLADMGLSLGMNLDDELKEAIKQL